MTSAAYWQRTIARFLVHRRGEFTIRFVDREGQRRHWTGNWVRPDLVGLLIERDGQWIRLCAWGDLVSVEDSRPEVPA